MSNLNHPYGVGLAYRFNLHEEVLHFDEEIDLLEIPTIDHIVRRRALSYPQAQEKFVEVLEKFPCIAHGIGMSIGSVAPLDEGYFTNTLKLLREAGISVFSEHLAYTRMNGSNSGSFLGMPFHDVSLDWLAQNYLRVRNRLGRPFALENVSLSFQIPDSDYTEPEFLSEFLKRTDATLLLDVTNLYNNCTNYGMDPMEYLHALPPDRISQIHLAGGHYDESGFLTDCHGYTVMSDVWEIYREALQYTSANMVIIERDYRYDPFREVMEDVRKAREIFYELRPQSSPDESQIPQEISHNEEELFDETAGEFDNLRSFQGAILRAITDDDFRKRTDSDPKLVCELFPMEDDWVARFAGCEKLDQKAMSWKENERLDHEDEERLRQWEWSQWATQT